MERLEEDRVFIGNEEKDEKYKVSPRTGPSNEDLIKKFLENRDRLDVGVYDENGNLIGFKDEWLKQELGDYYLSNDELFRYGRNIDAQRYGEYSRP